MAETPQIGGDLAALDAALTLSVIGLGSIGFEVDGSWAGTLSFEGSIGGTYSPLSVVGLGSTTAVTSTTANGLWVGAVGGLRLVRVRMSAYTSGSAAVHLQAAVASLSNAAGSGSSPTGLTPGTATSATVGTSSSLIVPANTARKGLTLILLNSSNTVSFGLGAAAVLSTGITLTQLGSVWEMDALTFTTGDIHAIASGASTKVCIQEFST